MNEPFRCVKSSPFPSGLADMFNSVSLWVSAISFAMRRARLEVLMPTGVLADTCEECSEIFLFTKESGLSLMLGLSAVYDR